jgi:hypothetical protein
MGSGRRSGGQHYQANYCQQGSHIPVTAQSSRVILPDRSPHTSGDHGMARRAGAKPR